MLAVTAALVVLAASGPGLAQDRETGDGPPSPEAVEGMRHPGPEGRRDRAERMERRMGRDMDRPAAHRMMRMMMPGDNAHAAVAIVRAMADYVGRQQNLRFAYDSDIEIVTPALEKIQFTSSGTAQLSRPDSLRATRSGGYADVELVADGRDVTIYGRNLQLYAQSEAQGSVDTLVDRLRNEFGLDLPAADLLHDDAFPALMEDVLEARHVGRGVVGGVECEHLAFRNHDTDWQLWVRVGNQPVPCRMVITSKMVGMAPQYTVEFHDWEDGVAFAPEAFRFDPPRGARRVDFSALSALDEIPVLDAEPQQGAEQGEGRAMQRGDRPGDRMRRERMMRERGTGEGMSPAPPEAPTMQPDSSEGDRP
jgi:hypothetical protein